VPGNPGHVTSGWVTPAACAASRQRLLCVLRSQWCARLLIGIVLLGFLALAAPMWAQQDVVTDIKIHGNRKIPADTVKARIFTRPGDSFDQQALERDFNSLWNTGYFEDLRFEREPTAKGLVLHIYVKERPVIRDIEYAGLSSVTTSDLLERFKTAKVGLSKESQYDPTRVKRAEVVIRELLAEHGRQFANVRTEVRPIPPAAVAVTFVIKEGPKVKVGKFIFQGNQNLPSRRLRTAMKNLKPVGLPHSIFLEALFSKTYDASKLSEDTERVRNEYQNEGYFKAVIQDPTTKIRDTGSSGPHIPLIQRGPGKAVDITMGIEEGDRYRLSAINFKGNKAIPNTKALRAQFPIKDGDIFSREKIAKGLENLRSAYGEFGYINFTSVPNTTFDDAKKTIILEIDIEEGKQYYVRRIEFQGNTTTRDKVIRREVVLEEGNSYNERLWKLGLLRINQLGYFEQLKPEDPNTTERKLDDKNASVDLTLKVKERGKNSIGLNGGVSGLAGAFIGINYSTNNLFGLGETLEVQASVGNRQRNILFGFTEPYLFDRPLQLGFTVYNRRYNFDQARQLRVLRGQSVNLSESQLNNLLNYTQASTGFTASLSYPLHRSFKRIGLTYAFDRSSTQTFSDASQRLFENIAFRGISGQNALAGIITSKFIPSFSFSTVDAAYSPKSGHALTLAAEISGVGGNVKFVRPFVSYKQFIPMQNRRNTIGVNLSASYLSGFGGLVAPPFDRAYLGGENDIRGFDIRSVTPYAYLPQLLNITLTNPDGKPVPRNPACNQTPTEICQPYTIPIPVQRIVIPGGDTSLVANIEYRVTIAGPVAVAPFMDIGINPILRRSQLRIADRQFAELTSQAFGCPVRDFALNCDPSRQQTNIEFERNLRLVSGTNFTPRMSTGIELQVFLPVINAPFRIYYAYNPLRLNSSATTPTPITRDMFPGAGDPNAGAGEFTYQQAISQFAPKVLLREPSHTFRFTVATTF
jgi:outer membrane protein insertion porin family